MSVSVSVSVRGIPAYDCSGISIVQCDVVVIAARAETWDARPVDVTVGRGDEARFNCSGSQVNWVRNVVSIPGVTLKLFRSPNHWYPDDHRGKFDVGDQYDLIVYDVGALSDAGVYQCDTIESAQFFRANLVVIGKGRIPRDTDADVLARNRACRCRGMRP